MGRSRSRSRDRKGSSSKKSRRSRSRDRDRKGSSSKKKKRSRSRDRSRRSRRRSPSNESSSENEADKHRLMASIGHAVSTLPSAIAAQGGFSAGSNFSMSGPAGMKAAHPMNAGFGMVIKPPGSVPFGGGFDKIAAKSLREVFVGNMPDTVTRRPDADQYLADFINTAMAGAFPDTPNLDLNHMQGRPCTSSRTKTSFAFVEFRTPEETTNFMHLNGLTLDGAPLKLQRPRDYTGPPDVIAGLSQIGIATGLTGGLRSDGMAPDAPPVPRPKPPPIPEHMRRPGDWECEKCENQNHHFRAFCHKCGTSMLGIPDPAAAHLMLEAPKAEAIPPSKCVQLCNMVTMKDLKDEEECEMIVEDVEEECAKHGGVISVQMPRPDPEAKTIPTGLGFIYVQFAEQDGATKCKTALSGRSFSGAAVEVHYYPEERFAKKEWIDVSFNNRAAAAIEAAGPAGLPAPPSALGMIPQGQSFYDNNGRV